MDATGGTVETFLQSHFSQSEDKIALTTASSRIAAT